MTPRTERSAAERATRVDPLVAGPGDRVGPRDVPARAWAGFGVAVLGALLAVVASPAGVVADAPPPGLSTALTAVLALVPPVVALVSVVAGRAVLGASVLVGAALLDPGRALLDAQLAVDAVAASRPEVLVTTSLAPLSAGPGLWLLLAGHLATAVAGLLVAGRAGAVPGQAYSAEFDDEPEPRGPGGLMFALVAGLVAAVGLVLAPFASDNPFQLADGLFGSPSPARYGLLLIALAVVAGAVVAAGARRQVSRGVAIGVAAGVAAVALPRVAAGLVIDELSPAPGPYAALVAAVALVVIAWWIGPAERVEHDVSLETSRLHPAAAALGLLAAIASVVGAFAPQLTVGGGLDTPTAYDNRLLAPAGALVLVLAVVLLVPRAANAVRPAFTVALASIPLAAAGALDTAFTASGLSPDVHAGVGVWFTVAALPFAVAAAVVAAMAGGAERDDVDMTERRLNVSLAAPAAAAVLFAVGAFALPTVRAPELVQAGIWSAFRLTSWGLLIALAAVAAAAVLAALSRPTRAAALLLGAAGVAGVRLTEYALTSGRAADAVPGQGTWLALACVVALVVGAIVAVSRR